MSHVLRSAEFSLTPSKYYFYAQLLLVVAGAAIVAVSPIVILAKIAGLLIFLGAGIGIYCHFRRQLPVQLFLLDSETHSWRLTCKSGDATKTTDLVLKPTQFVTRYWVILYFKKGTGGELSLVIPQDSLSGEQHRLLRKLLLNRASPGG